MEKLALTIPGMSGTPIDSGLPTGTPRGGLFNYDANNNPIIGGTGVNAIQVFLVLAVTIAIFMSLYFVAKGGLEIIQSKGDKEAVQKGRERVIFAMFGLIMIFLSFVMLNAINAFFGINLLPFVPFFNIK